MSRIHYAGYEAIVEYDDVAAVFHGEVLLPRDIVTFQSHSMTLLEQAMAVSLKDYVDFCRSRGEMPETSG